MRNNQFAIQPTTPAERQAELKALRLLPDDWQALTPKALLKHFLVTSHPAAKTATSANQWLNGLAATKDQSVMAWLTSDDPLTTPIFDLIALQLLHFIPEVDYQVTAPVAAVEKIRLPLLDPTSWNVATVTDAFYQLLISRNNNGYRHLDQLVADGALAWTYQLPATEKPLIFNGQPIACFDPATFIREVVYVETDLDTDFDGHADLVKAEIIRPVESNHGLKVPAVFTASPYNQGTNDAWGEKVTHQVNHPLTHKLTSDQAPAELHFPQPQSYQTITGEASQATETFSETPSYTLNNYLAARGYAIVYAAGIGTKDSDGLQTCGSPEQTASMQAVVEWLHGDRQAFTDRTSGQLIKAAWCNGHVGMTGRSYLGTLSTAVATTGVAGLSAIVSEAAISSWYDYYRENGLVMAPGGFQGEDADVLAAETFSRTENLADYLKIKPTNDHYLHQMARAQDRETGNYNAFWAARNYRPQIKNIQCPVMMVHGLNDDNVKPNQVKALYDGLKANGIPAKIILHQGKHIYINAFQSLDYSEMINLWFAKHLWRFDNQADEVLPAVLVQDNYTPQTWRTVNDWDGVKTTHFNWGTGCLTPKAVEATTQFFTDGHPAEQYQAWCHHPNQWQQALLADNGSFSAHFRTANISQKITYRGTPHVHARVKVNADHGLLSAFLVDRGLTKRLTVSPVTINPRSLRAGFHFGSDDLREFKLASQVSPAKVISFGHINLQNRHSASQVDDLQPNQFVDVDFPLQPIFHRLPANHQLELIIFATDYQMTLRGNEPLTYTLDLANCWLEVPRD
ncbi:Xaa-Pro dipeptidyl-peptidase [Lactobacillus sp. 3B(2020)]|uniref:Xaa-Pro dipeptidyl-peptidase n=1 Tax=Lactobacillus sp. 3B(2020) TaxID=2695882 RepID=UPI0015DEB587|nr:Xaa-Pro dipeptidyl-peptidase [Lactobacillus sp. 3B(2020)]QLL69246.1 Xaa-Pro dipeptidyl-peptidase [Lactobacillus sp. 3B(2020)]